MRVTDSERRIVDHVERARGKIVETLRAFVRINTVNPYSGEDAGGSEAAGQDAVEAAIVPLGARVRRLEPPPDTYERAGVIGPRGRLWRNRPNLVGEWRFGPDADAGPHVIVVGHIDTVGVQGMDDPFGGEVRDGTVRGRGASDDKGGLAAAIGAIGALAAHPDGLRGRLTFLSVVDEECNGSGAGIIACALAGIRGDMAVSVDGAGLGIIRGCGGVVTAEVVVHGRPGHGSIGNGTNAVEKALPLAEAILRFGAERRAARPSCLLNLGVFHGGTLAAVIPGEARMMLNIVYDIDEAAEAREKAGTWGGRLVWDAFERTVREVESADEWLRAHPSDLVWVKDLVPYDVPADAPVIRDVAAACRDVLGSEPAIGKMVAWTDSCWLPVLADTPVAVFGPAEESVVHGPDEHVRIDRLVDAAKVLGLALGRMLRRSGD